MAPEYEGDEYYYEEIVENEEHDGVHQLTYDEQPHHFLELDLHPQHQP